MRQNKYFPGLIIDRRWVFLAAKCALALLLIGSVTSCNIEPRPYITTFDAPKLTEFLKVHRKLCIVAFTSDPSLYTQNGEELNVNPGFLPFSIVDQDTNRKQAAEITTKLTFAHFEKTVAGLSERFSLVGPSVYDEMKNPIIQTQQIKVAIAQNGAEFGLAVHDQFGWNWAQENTGVETYYYTTCATIYNGEGQPIWKFCNKGSLTPKLFDLKSFPSGIFGAAPPMESITGDFETYFINYPRFILRLIEEDAVGKAHKAWFEDYFPPNDSLDKSNRPFILNANDERYMPYFK